MATLAALAGVTSPYINMLGGLFQSVPGLTDTGQDKESILLAMP